MLKHTDTLGHRHSCGVAGPPPANVVAVDAVVVLGVGPTSAHACLDSPDAVPLVGWAVIDDHAVPGVVVAIVADSPLGDSVAVIGGSLAGHPNGCVSTAPTLSGSRALSIVCPSCFCPEKTAADLFPYG